MNKIFTTALALLLLSSACAQTIRPFTPRFADNVRGGMTFVANSIITQVVPNGNGSTTDFTSLPPACGATTGTSGCYNNELRGRAIDVDGDPSTHKSSSATLALPACNTVVYAGLYWAAGTTISGNPANPLSRTGSNFVKLKVPGSATYQTVAASALDTLYNVFQFYQAYADVTTLVQAGGAGSYTVADVVCDTTRINTHAGWTMVVVYRDSTQPTRNITVFDGVALFNGSGSASSNITLSGFHAPPTGAVAARIGVVCYDGDRSSTDSFAIRRNDNGVFVNQTAAGESAAATSNNNDSWNSSITVDGANVTTRNPAYANTYGYDADIFTLANAGKTYIRNNDSTLTMRIGTPSEGYVLGVVATQIDVYAPEMLLESATTDVNGGTYALGDTLLVSLSIRNTGTDTTVNARIFERMPSAFSYVPNSLVVDGTPRTDATGDDVAEYSAASKSITIRTGAAATSTTGGTVRSNGTDVYTASYRLAISSSCDSVGYTPLTLSRQASIFYGGLVDTDADTAAARPMPVAGCTQGPTPDAIVLNTGCAVPLSVSLLHFSAAPTTGGVKLDWRMHEHGDVASYEITASDDGRGFESLHSIPAHGGTGLRDYSFTDARTPTASATHYRLLIRGLDGGVEHSRVLIVRHKEPGANEPVLFPNPGRDALRVLNAPADAMVELHDGQGRRVASGPASAPLATAGLPTGVYFVRITSAGSHRVLRWVKG